MIVTDGINHGKLQSIIVGELRKAGLKHKLKKIILKSVKENKSLFGAPLAKVQSCSVICCGNTLSIPVAIREMSSILRNNGHMEGLFRKAGSQSRQKDIKRLLDAGGCVSEGLHHPIDIASVLKLYLRSLPEPLIGREVQELLIRSRLTAADTIKPILHTLLLLPVLHVHLLHYVMELLHYISSRHKENLMDSSNLAIVMAPSIMPLPTAASSAQRLEHHVALVKIFIENSKHIGILTEDLMAQLDEDSDLQQPKQKKRRSGSLNRMFNGLRKIVSGSVNTPGSIQDNSNKTPVLTKSAIKRKYNSQEGLSAKVKDDIKEQLPHKQLTFTPVKMSITDKKRLRLNMIDATLTPNDDFNIKNNNNFNNSFRSNNFLTSSDNLLTPRNTIDLSPENKDDKDYVKISKQEYEDIKSRVSAIETTLSREFTDLIPNVEPLKQVQNAYEKTLEEVALLDCAASDRLARRLSKELKIRPSNQNKIIRSPSARKIDSIRRRSKENVTKIVRHKSWNESTLSQTSQSNIGTFYPYVGLTRHNDANLKNANVSSECEKQYKSIRQRHQLRNRTSFPFHYRSNSGEKNSENNSNTQNDSFCEDSLNMSPKRDLHNKRIKEVQRQKWKNAAVFFMERSGELEESRSGRPSVNKLRSQNAGAVLAKAKLFESSSDLSSERQVQSKFARKPRISSSHINKPIATDNLISTKHVTGRMRLYHQDLGNKSKTVLSNKNTSPLRKKITENPMKSPQTVTPVIKKPLYTNRNVRLQNRNEIHKTTPMKVTHLSPRRQSPRLKAKRVYMSSELSEN